MAEGELWGEMLNVLKDISSYLSKEGDSDQEKAIIDTPPKVKEKQDELVGGANPAGKPGDVGFTKAVTDAAGKTQLKKADPDDEDTDDEDEKEGKKEDEDEDDVEELKSLLKDIRSALMTKSADSPELNKMIETQVRKALPSAMDRMLRKQGYSVSRADITKIGLEDGILKKSSDEVPSEESTQDAGKMVEDLSKKSWGELGRLRETTGDFRGFPR
jgi:hypothetical protein